MNGQRLLFGATASAIVIAVIFFYEHRANENVNFNVHGIPRMHATEAAYDDTANISTATNRPLDSVNQRPLVQSGVRIAKRGSSNLTFRSMSAENLRRVEKQLELLGSANDQYHDYISLLKAEPEDPQWSPPMQSKLEQNLRAHGSGLNGLEIMPVHCTRTICAIAAVGGGVPVKPNAEFSQLTNGILGEPWFQTDFQDLANPMTSDDKGMVYVLLLERK